MFSIEQIKLPVGYQEDDLKHAICRELKIDINEIIEYKLLRKSLDARHKDHICYLVSVAVRVKNKSTIQKNLLRLNHVKEYNESIYQIKICGSVLLKHSPVVVGAGPAGLFCTYFLAKQGYCPILIERGDTIENRTQKIEHFWNSGELDPESNIQFGEGGAGTYSDGKLNTMVKDTNGRIKEVLRIFTMFGAPSEIMYLNKPHIGTDLLRGVIHSMTEEIKRLGGTIMYRTKLTGMVTEHGKIKEIILNKKEHMPCDILVLALGHSARDTALMLYENAVIMEPKAFAVGVRIEHPQSMIDQLQYGSYNQMSQKLRANLPAADYKLTYTTKKGRGVYSFCMCPGGFVVNAASEEGHISTNGMSNYLRNETNANSALIVTVIPDDFKCFGDTPLAGIEFQRHYEKLAFCAGNGKVPVQMLGDFCNDMKSTSIGAVCPNIQGGYTLSNLRKCLPDFVSESLFEAMDRFGRILPGFDREDAVLSGIEARTSSPLRILRSENLEATVSGVYPCGEGAGYAGGIVSAAVDGIKVFEAIISKYKQIG